jgi:hypothetical protein
MLPTYIIYVAVNCDYNIVQATAYVLTVMGKRKISVLWDVKRYISLKVTFRVDFQQTYFYILEDRNLHLKFCMMGKFCKVKTYTTQLVFLVAD